MAGPWQPDLSYCVVNTNGREYLLACLEAIERDPPGGIEREVLVLDNASDDGSAEAVRDARRPRCRLIALERRAGKAENDSTLLREARGRYCLLLNEDSELRAGARGGAGRGARRRPPGRGCRRRSCSTPRAGPVPCAWRFPGVRTALVGALFLHRRLTVQSGGLADAARSTGRSRARCWSAARPREEVGYLDPDFFVYYDECDFCKRLRDAGWRVLYVPAARAVHHDQLSTDLAAGLPRIVEFHRNRDLYMRKHHSRAGGPRGARADRLDLRAAGAGGDCAAGPAGAGLPGPRPPGAAPRARRGPARGRRQALAGQSGRESSSRSSAS